MADSTEHQPTNGSGATAPAAPAYESGQQFLAEIRSANALLERKIAADRLGLSFWSNDKSAYLRDLFEVAGYPKSKDLTVEVYRSWHERGGIAKTLVEIYPKATWAGGADIVEDPDPGTETPFELAVRGLDQRLGLWDRLERVDIAASLGRYGALLIGAPGDMATELKRLSGPESILYLTPLAEDHAEILEEEGDPENERFGLPTMYRVDLGVGLTGRAKVDNRKRTAHHSRILHVAEGLLENDLLGEPALRAVLNRLIDLEKIIAGGSEATWKRGDPGIHANVPLFTPDGKPLKFDQPTQAAMQAEIESYRHNLSRVIKTSGVELNLLESSIPAFGGNADAVMKQISAIRGAPMRILEGSERGKLASSQDASNWADRVSRRRERHGALLIRTFLDRMVKYGALPEPAEYEVVWPEIDELTPDEKAAVVKELALANQAQVAAGLPPIISSNEIRDSVLKIGPLEEIEGFEDADTGEPVEPPADRLQAAKLRVAVRRGIIRRRRPAVRGTRVAEAVELVRLEATAGPDEPEYRSVHRAADANAPRVMALFLALWTSMAARIDASEIESALRAGAVGAAEQSAVRAIAQVEEEFRPKIQEAIARCLTDGAEAALKSARGRGSWFRSAVAWDEEPFRAAAFAFDFDSANPRAVAWALNRSSNLITEIGPDTRDAVRELIGSGFTQGIPPAKLAGDIKSVVGLRTDQLRSLANLEAQLRDPENFGRLVTRFPPAPTLRTQPGFRVRVPKGGLTEAQLQAKLAKYREMQHNLRARTIARSETIRAANSGQQQLWLQARDEGQLPADQKRVWIHSGDEAVRDSHLAMGGQVRELDEKFQKSDGGEIEPGEEVNCRCSQGIATPEDLERAQAGSGSTPSESGLGIIDENVGPRDIDQFAEGASGLPADKVRSELEKFANSLPDDTEEWQYFIHSTRDISDIRSIAARGLDPALAKGDQFFASAVSDVRAAIANGSTEEAAMRLRGGGHVLFRLPPGDPRIPAATIDVVEAGLSYQQRIFKSAIDSSEVVKLSRNLDRADEVFIARYAVSTPGVLDEMPTDAWRTLYKLIWGIP